MLSNYAIGIEFSFGSPLSSEARFASLTSREREILFELVKASNVKVVAKNLGISRFTVNQHLRSIYTKLNVNTKLDAVMFFLSYAHCQARKKNSNGSDGPICKARKSASCDAMICHLALFCLKDGFCMIEDTRQMRDSSIEPVMFQGYVSEDGP